MMFICYGIWTGLTCLHQPSLQSWKKISSYWRCSVFPSYIFSLIFKVFSDLVYAIWFFMIIMLIMFMSLWLMKRILNFIKIIFSSCFPCIEWGTTEDNIDLTIFKDVKHILYCVSIKLWHQNSKNIAMWHRTYIKWYHVCIKSWFLGYWGLNLSPTQY